MRCKVGDLAVIVNADNKADLPHVGKIIRCVRWQSDEWGGGWFTDPMLKVVAGPRKGGLMIWHDDDLRPIRDQDGEDETLRIAGSPIHAHVKQLNDRMAEALKRLEQARQDVKERT
jgi:hypothetical protein